MYVAVDVGTSGIKAVAFEANGEEARVVRRPIAVDRRRKAWAEQDMDACWALVAEAVREIADAVGEVEFVAITAQGDGCWLVDDEGRAVRPAILWNDGRAASYVGTWMRDGTMQRGFALNGSVSFPGLANAILRWLAEHEPETLARSRFALTCGSWIFSKFTGRTLIEASDASAPFLDLESGSYSDTLLGLYGLADCRAMLAPVARGADTVAPLSEAAAAETGLPAGTPVVLAPYDVVAAALGAGARTVGDAVLVLGTTFLCGIITDRPQPAGAPSGTTVSLGFPGLYLRLFPTLAGMEVLEWAAGFLGRRGAPETVELAMTGRPGARGLHFLPYLSP
ncbi:MAG TPA: FGGY family carbohydrate kinase, partial [Pararhizobium sp.]|nr:FGGY family carbohydrate kinase [Pararhizobium sp.]